ncbi:MAG TPA: biotin--[acetyl-CoA-carboxylase] ligase [Clostridia bacterium]|nr:biotin--[acetyl-CoA-carboxylase] ligase [Clostridia bacterium]
MLLTQKKVNKIFLEQGSNLPCSFVKKTDSTNNLAKKLILSGQIKKGVVLAQMQTKGRGRYDRVFLSKSGKGVYMTFVSPFLVEYGASIGGICCLAVVDAVKNLYDIDCAVKWPNDVLFKEKKLCGILSETVVFDEARYILIGVGVNVNYTDTDFGSLSDTAVSVSQIIGKKTDTVVLAAEIGKNLDRIFADYKNDYQQFIKRYSSICDTIGREIIYQKDGQSYCGKAMKIDEDCSLIIETDGKTEKIAWGEIVIKK